MKRAMWTCSECGEKVPIDVAFAAAGSTVTVSLPETALADAFAHAWTHRERS
jgi:hypothetical protein